MSRHLRLALLPVVASCLLVELGCGRKAPPQPPMIRVAEQTRDVAVQQKESRAIVEWSYPSSTTSGGALEDVETIELWRATLPLGQEPVGTSQRDRAVRVQLLESQGERIAILDAEGRERATRGPLLHVEDDLEAWHQSEGLPESPVIWYAVRTVCCRGRMSAFSNIARLIPRVPPPPPSWLEGIGSRDGIELSWQQEPQVMTVVERSADGNQWTTITAEPIYETELKDTEAAQGHLWSYRLRSVTPGEGGGRVLGEPSSVLEVDHPDIYPPEAPQNLVCLPEGSTVRLRWAVVPAEVTYSIYRQLPGKARELVVKGHANASFADESPPYGRLTYSVHAVDVAGNESEAASCEAVIGAEP